MDKNNKIIELEKSDYANLKSFISKKKIQIDASEVLYYHQQKLEKKY